MIKKKFIIFTLIILNINNFIFSGQLTPLGWSSYFEHYKNKALNFCQNNPVPVLVGYAARFPFGASFPGYWWKTSIKTKQSPLPMKNKASFKQYMFESREEAFWSLYQHQKEDHYNHKAIPQEMVKENPIKIQTFGNNFLIQSKKREYGSSLKYPIKSFHFDNSSKDCIFIFNTKQGDYAALYNIDQHSLKPALKRFEKFPEITDTIVFDNDQVLFLGNSISLGCMCTKCDMSELQATIKKKDIDIRELINKVGKKFLENINNKKPVVEQGIEFSDMSIIDIQHDRKKISEEIKNSIDYINNQQENICLPCRQEGPKKLKKHIKEYQACFNYIKELITDSQVYCVASDVDAMIKAFETYTIKELAEKYTINGVDYSHNLYEIINLSKEDWLKMSPSKVKMYCKQFETVYNDATPQGKLIRQIAMMGRGIGKKMYDAYIKYLENKNKEGFEQLLCKEHSYKHSSLNDILEKNGEIMGDLAILEGNINRLIQQTKQAASS